MKGHRGYRACHETSNRDENDASRIRRFLFVQTTLNSGNVRVRDGVVLGGPHHRAVYSF